MRVALLAALGCAREDIVEEGAVADVVDVSASGADGAYTVLVTLRSDETGCDQYADYWEILTPDGELVYRRILDHSHPDEQPFARSGGPVAVSGTDEIVVRGHMYPNGYGGAVLKGTIAGGFAPFAPPDGFAEALQDEPPLPEDCLF